MAVPPIHKAAARISQNPRFWLGQPGELLVFCWLPTQTKKGGATGICDGKDLFARLAVRLVGRYISSLERACVLPAL